MITEDELKGRYPYLFAGRHIVGHEFPSGWLAILERLYATIDSQLSDAEKARVYIVQQKEKLAGLRVYLSCSPRRVDIITQDRVICGETPRGRRSSLSERLSPLVRAAEEESLRTCMICGAPGAVRSDRPWMVTLCDEHANMQG